MPLPRAVYGRIRIEMWDRALNAFMTGKTIYEKDALIGRLRRRAQEIWDQGPSLPSEKEFYHPYLGIEDRRRRLKLELNNQEEMVRALAKAHSDILFWELVYGYCKSRGRWTSKLDYIIANFQKDHPKAYQLCLRYLRAQIGEAIVKH